MKLTYRGNQVFVLPLPGGAKIFHPGQSHSLSQEELEGLGDRKKEHLQALKTKGELIFSQSMEPSPSNPTPLPAPERKEEEAKEVKVEKEEKDILDGAYKTVLKRLESIEDPEVLRGLLGREKRPSVLKAIKEKLGE